MYCINVLHLGTEAVIAVTGEVSFHNHTDLRRKNTYFLLGASGFIWCSVPTQILIAKAKSFAQHPFHRDSKAFDIPHRAKYN